MPRAFLSHSSRDKDFVRQVAELIGGDRCIFDEHEFETGMKNIDEIFRGLEKSDIFVYFISNTSLESAWVQEELNNARDKLGSAFSKLSQIFPIIIDEAVSYEDRRIASFLKAGFNSYNLRHIRTPQIASRKIKAQMVAMAMENDYDYKKRVTFFYGRDEELSDFKKRLDDMTKKPLKCLVVSGIDGIGRKSFISKALREAQLTESYYFPMVISLNRNESIEDLILKLSDLGLGDYKLPDITSLSSMKKKEDILSELILQAQEYKEHIIIEDDFCLISMDGNIRYWFENAIEKVRNQYNISIVSRVNPDTFRYQKNEFFYFIQMKELTSSDSVGFLRSLSKNEGVEFIREDLEFMKDCLSGYPPQIQYCVELAKQKGISYVRNHTYEVLQMPEQVSSKILLLAIDEKEEKKYKSLLSLLADFETTPVTLLHTLTRQDQVYRTALNKFRSLSICYGVGSSNEYLKINTFLQNFIQRNRFEQLDDIKEVLTYNVKEFEEKCEQGSYTDSLEIVELSYYIKQNLIKGKLGRMPERFLYSTVFLQSIIDLYNHRKNDQVIQLVKGLKGSNRMAAYDDEIQDRIQYYYCLSLARRRKSDFLGEVEYFNKPEKYNTYHFLKGFNFRLSGDFKNAEYQYQMVLDKNANHMITRRELVTLYISTQEYDKACELAKTNYRRDKNNIYFIQSYFESLVYKKKRNPQDETDLQEIVDLVTKMYAMPNQDYRGIYSQILARNEAFVKCNKMKAVEYVEEGIKENKGRTNTYLLKDLFDIYEHFKDIKNMENAYRRLSEEVASEKSGDARMEMVVFTKGIVLDAYKGTGREALKLKINENKGLPQGSKDHLLKNVDRILDVRDERNG